MSDQYTIVQAKFMDLLMHLGADDGASAIGRHLPVFIASLLHGVPDVEAGLVFLCDDVRGHLESMTAIREMTGLSLQ